MTSTERWRRRRDRLVSEGLCGRCGSAAGPHLCQRRQADLDYRRVWREQGRCVANGCQLPPGSLFKCCEECRRRSRERYNPKRAATGPQRRSYESTRWKTLEAEMAVSCPTCELRGPHVCLSRVDPHSRTGPGRVFP